MQITLGLILYFAVTALSAERRLLHRQGESRNRILKRVDETIAILYTTIIEFQEAQSWFIIVNQIASLVGLNGKALFRATSFVQLNANTTYTYVMSSACTVLSAMGLVMVSLESSRSLYIHTLSTFAWVFAVYGWIHATMITSQPNFDDLDLPHSVKNMASCGGHPPPSVFCRIKTGTDDVHVRDDGSFAFLVDESFQPKTFVFVTTAVTAFAVCLAWHNWIRTRRPFVTLAKHAQKRLDFHHRFNAQETGGMIAIVVFSPFLCLNLFFFSRLLSRDFVDFND